MTKKAYTIFNAILLIIGAIFIYELLRDSMRPGDFIGYVDAGNLVLADKDIYSDIHNTWPPLFSVFSVILSIGDNLSPFFIRFLWLLGSIVSIYFITSLSVHMVFNKPLTIRGNSNGIQIQDPLIVVPLLIMLRFILDNLASVQINIYMVLCSLLSIVFFIKKKYIWVGLLLGLTISLKVYTVFFLFYFLYKREFKPVAWTILFLLIFNSIPFVVFGFDQSMEYYHHWIGEVVPLSYKAEFRNQSVFGAFLRYFTTSDPTQNMYVNFLDIQAHTIKLVTYGMIFAASMLPIYLFRKKIKDRRAIRSLLEYSVIFTIIPIFSPVAWKAFFIFLWVPYFLLYLVLYRFEFKLTKKVLTRIRGLFWLSVVLNVFSTELFVGYYLSDLLEAYSVVTIGTVILLIIQIFVAGKAGKIHLAPENFRTGPRTPFSFLGK